MLAISILAALPDVTDGDGSAEYIRHMKESLCLLAVYSVRVSVRLCEEKKRETERERAGTQKTQGWWNIKLKERKKNREKKKRKEGKMGLEKISAEKPRITKNLKNLNNKQKKKEKRKRIDEKMFILNKLLAKQSSRI